MVKSTKTRADAKTGTPSVAAGMMAFNPAVTQA